MAVITISRGSFSGGKMLAECLAKALDYRCVDRDVIVEKAAAYGVPQDQLKDALEKPPTFWDRFKHTKYIYLTLIQAALAEEVQYGKAVYHGNAGHLLLRGISHVFCIRLIAPLSYRTDVVMVRQGLSHEDAVRYIEEKDRQRRDWTRFLYGVDWLDPSFYDLTVNLQTLALDSAVEIAAVAVERPEFQVTDDSRKAMADLLLASRVRAALAANRSTAPAAVDVRADGDVVYLKGRIRPASMVEDIIDVASAVPGVKRVDRRNLDAPEFTV